MFTIRSEQMSQLQAHMMRKYEDRVIAKIAEAYPKRFKQEGEEKVREFIQAAIRKGEPHGITEDDETEQFALLLFAHGLDFEKAPGKEECRRILNDPDLPGDAKVNLLEREMESEADLREPPTP